MPFYSLGLSEPIVRAVNEKGYTTPSPIQVEAIPAVLSIKDVMAAAQTGTGKTASFTLPMLQRLAAGPPVKKNHIRALVLTPTRELAAQVADSVVAYGKHLSLKSGAVFGGVNINPQIKKLRDGVDVLAATPGRLLDLYNQRAVKFTQLEILVLDEADRMLDMGFIRDIEKIISALPSARQTLLFSATLTEKVSKLGNLLNNPVRIGISPKLTAAQTVRQSVYEVDSGKKSDLLIHLFNKKNWGQVLIFTRTRHGANRLVKKMVHSGIAAAAIHSDKTQRIRTRTLADFKAYKIRALVATDIASRGLDIVDLPHVINYELPDFSDDYIHRIGRTGRAGAEGEAIALVSAGEVGLLSGVETVIRQTLVREVEEGFEPTHNVPLTKLKENSKKPTIKRREGRRSEGAFKRGKEKSRSGYKPRRDSNVQPRDAKGFRGKPRRDSNVQPRDAKVLQGKPRRDSGYKPKVLRVS